MQFDFHSAMVSWDITKSEGFPKHPLEPTGRPDIEKFANVCFAFAGCCSILYDSYLKMSADSM